MPPETRTITFTPEDTDRDEITPEWLMGVAEGLEEEHELPEGSRITRVELVVEIP